MTGLHRKYLNDDMIYYFVNNVFFPQLLMKWIFYELGSHKISH